MTVVSFDIDGTLETGGPPDPVSHSDVDEYHARLAGFEWWFADSLPTPDVPGWIF